MSKTTRQREGYPPQGWRLYLNLSVFWFALNFLWAGMLTMVIQILVERMVGAQKDLYLGWTLGIGALVSTIVVIIVGMLSDRSRWIAGKRRPYILIGAVFSVPALIWMAYISTIPMLILDFCLIQLWVNVATSPYQAMLPDMVPKDRQGTASAYMGMGTLLGQLGGFVVTGLLIERPHGLLSIMIAYSGVMLIAMLYTLRTLHERTAWTNPAARLGFFAAIAESLRIKPKENPDFFRLIASRFAINMGFYTATEFLLYYVTYTLCAPNPKLIFTYIGGIATLSGAVGNWPAGILADRISKKRVVYVSIVITAIAITIFLLTSSVTVALCTAFIFGAGFGAFSAVDWAFVANLLPARDEAKYMGIWHVAFTVPQVIAPLIGGIIAYYANQHMAHGFGYRAVLFLTLIYLAIGAILIRPIREKSPS